MARDTRGNTPLHIACATQSRDTLERLTRPVAPQEVAALRLNYRPVHVSGILAADLYNFTGECRDFEKKKTIEFETPKKKFETFFYSEFETFFQYFLRAILKLKKKIMGEFDFLQGVLSGTC